MNTYSVFVFVQAGEEKVGTDESRFVEIFSTRSFGQLKLVFEHYNKVQWS